MKAVFTIVVDVEDGTDLNLLQTDLVMAGEGHGTVSEVRRNEDHESSYARGYRAGRRDVSSARPPVTLHLAHS